MRRLTPVTNRESLSYQNQDEPELPGVAKQPAIPPSVPSGADGEGGQDPPGNRHKPFRAQPRGGGTQPGPPTGLSGDVVPTAHRVGGGGGQIPVPPGVGERR